MAEQELEGFSHCMDARYMLLNLAHFPMGSGDQTHAFTANNLLIDASPQS